MYAKWTFGLVVLVIPNFLDASAALARLRIPALRPIAPFMQIYVRSRLGYLGRNLYTGPLRTTEPSDAWDRVSPYKQQACAEIFSCANKYREALRNLRLFKEKFDHESASWGLPQEVREKLVSEDPQVRTKGKLALRNHFMIQQARAEKPPK